MLFAPPHATLSPQIMRLIDGIMADAPTQHIVHYMKGLDQVRAFMAQTHGQADGTPLSFEDMIARESSIWQEHYEKAKKAKDAMASARPTLNFLPNVVGIDIRVHARGRPDDAIYNASEYARKYLPRGNYIAEWRVSDNRVLYFPMVRAYPKFTGHEDDGELASEGGSSDDNSVTSEALSKYFTEPASATRAVISTVKENGEAAHLAVLKLDNGSYVYLVGSKNVHMAIQSEADIEPACQIGMTAPGQNPFAGAKPVAYGIMRMLSALEPEKRTAFCEFLWQTRLTASFELLCPGHQHVELLDVPFDTPVLFGFSLPTMQTMPGVEVCVNPLLGYALARACGVRTVHFEVVPYTGDEFKSVLQAIKRGYQTEGKVNLYVNGAGHVIGLQKYKTAWYVSLRAIREKAKSFLTNVLGKKQMAVGDALVDSHKSIEKRFRAIRTFLGLSAASTDQYAALGKAFVTYIADVRLANCGGSEVAMRTVQHDVVDLFPVVWQAFLQATGANDRIDSST
ncbi:Aste57867_9192 [Aphanomyces stellatus]|uniref:Aste57867_9192 protein n=1 Tax=Aphanomyces stellatus TaxID=120398 RepID=A0A485KME1_9STRA|nr:hypothetical protein As57867_009156 [Aphanomyces stellatus]VFT86075.1 Aste57867_9192 [Aphanomyces stellatus]